MQTYTASAYSVAGSGNERKQHVPHQTILYRREQLASKALQDDQLNQQAQIWHPGGERLK